MKIQKGTIIISEQRIIKHKLLLPMSLIGDNIRTQNVAWLDDEAKQLMMNYLQGHVYCWCKNNQPNSWFAARDLLGGVNRDWTDTPLQSLYEHYRSDLRLSHEQAERRAGIDVGKLLKEVLAQDNREFETRMQHVRMYRWTGRN